MWDLVSWPEIEPKFLELGPRSPSHWIIRKVPYRSFFDHHFSLVQSLSRVQLFVTPWTAARQASLSFTIFRSLPKLMSIESVMPSSHLILCRPLLLLPSIFPASGPFPMSQIFSSGQSIVYALYPIIIKAKSLMS